MLSDKEKRKQYDTFGSDGFHQRFSQEDIFRSFDFGDIFKEFGFGGTNPFMGRRGGMRFSRGSGSPFSSHSGRQQQIKGSDLVYELPLTLLEVAKGTNKSISFAHKGRHEKITVKIPKGMITGKKLRVAGKGEPSPYGGPPGDLYIQSKVVNDPIYDAKEYDLYANRDLKLSEAILGTSISVPTLEGIKLSLKIPPGTRHGTKMRLSGHGLPAMRGNKRGDLYVNIQIPMPKHLNKEQKKLIKQLKAIGL